MTCCEYICRAPLLHSFGPWRSFSINRSFFFIYTVCWLSVHEYSTMQKMLSLSSVWFRYAIIRGNVDLVVEYIIFYCKLYQSLAAPHNSYIKERRFLYYDILVTCTILSEILLCFIIIHKRKLVWTKRDLSLILITNKPAFCFRSRKTVDYRLQNRLHHCWKKVSMIDMSRNDCRKYTKNRVCIPMIMWLLLYHKEQLMNKTINFFSSRLKGHTELGHA